jgi:hypothetical protein
VQARESDQIVLSSFVPSGSETVQCGMTDLPQTMFPPEKRVYFGCGYKKAEKALETYLKRLFRTMTLKRNPPRYIWWCFMQ